MDRKQILLRRIRVLTWFFIIGLVISGATAIPLVSEVDALVKYSGAEHIANVSDAPPAWAHWLLNVQQALHENSSRYPFLFYGMDWLAFGHFVIAIAFIGALREPVRNAWLFTFGMIACVCVVPYALVCGAARGIPVWWRLVDCSFGVIGFVPLWFCKRWTAELERNQN
jgi:hypothetical protein